MNKRILEYPARATRRRGERDPTYLDTAASGNVPASCSRACSIPRRRIPGRRRAEAATKSRPCRTLDRAFRHVRTDYKHVGGRVTCALGRNDSSNAVRIKAVHALAKLTNVIPSLDSRRFAGDRRLHSWVV